MNKLLVEMYQMLVDITYTIEGECSCCGMDCYDNHEDDCELMLLLKKVEEHKNG